MNTAGHRKVLGQGAGPRLRRALDEAGRSELGLDALFLGNWLADLSQVSDPRADLAGQLSRDLRAARHDARVGIGAAFSAGLFSVGPALPPKHRDALDRIVRAATPAIDELLAALLTLPVVLAAPEGKGAEPSASPKLIALVKLAGYVKFARPSKDREVIPFVSYRAIADELCRQYFPHEHLDRPTCATSYKDRCVAAWGVQAGGDASRLLATGMGSGGRDAHLYRYLVDDRTVLAGRLAEVDRDWAGRAFGPTSTLPPLDDHLWLARLGHTLHGVEDFFAHSSFVEHAVSTAGSGDLTSALRGASVGSDRAGAKIARRLLRYTPDVDRPGVVPQREPAVVTGYFDAWDTLNSVMHMVEHIADRHHDLSTPGSEEVAGTVLKEIGKGVLDAAGLEDVAELAARAAEPPQPPWQATVLNALDAVAAAVDEARRTAAQPVSGLVEDGVRADPVLSALGEPVVRDLVIPAVRVLVTVGPAGVTVFKAIRTIQKFLASPTAFLLEPSLRTLAGSVGAKPVSFVAKVALGVLDTLYRKRLLTRLDYLVRERLASLLRGDRIGCHSLLAKDVPQEPLYAEMFSCARHVDWFLVDALCRWSDPDWARRVGDDERWVDWDDLLGAFLRSPVDTPETTVTRMRETFFPTQVQVEVVGDDETFATLWGRASSGSGLQLLSYDAMLRSVLTTWDASRLGGAPDPVAGTGPPGPAIAEAVEAAGIGRRIGATGYALTPGLVVTIPAQTSFAVDVLAERTWFRDVIGMTDRQWEEHAARYEKERLVSSPTAFAHHRWRYHPGPGPRAVERRRDQFIDEAAKLRVRLETAYNQP